MLENIFIQKRKCDNCSKSNPVAHFHAEFEVNLSPLLQLMSSWFHPLMRQVHYKINHDVKRGTLHYNDDVQRTEFYCHVITTQMQSIKGVSLKALNSLIEGIALKTSSQS